MPVLGSTKRAKELWPEDPQGRSDVCQVAGSAPLMPALGMEAGLFIVSLRPPQLTSSRVDGATERKPVSEKKK